MFSEITVIIKHLLILSSLVVLFVHDSSASSKMYKKDLIKKHQSSKTVMQPVPEIDGNGDNNHEDHTHSEDNFEDSRNILTLIISSSAVTIVSKALSSINKLFTNSPKT